MSVSIIRRRLFRDVIISDLARRRGNIGYSIVNRIYSRKLSSTQDNHRVNFNIVNQQQYASRRHISSSQPTGDTVWRDFKTGKVYSISKAENDQKLFIAELRFVDVDLL